jgi:alanine dehydrogenase
MAEHTLLLSRSDVERLLNIRDCIDAVESVFRLLGEGKVPAPGILSVKASRGGLHVKAGLLPGEKSYIVAKLNTNFPGNRTQPGLPTIQGLVALFDADHGRLLAVLDSIELTIRRTAAASAVAAKYLARADSTVATLCGCGQQAATQLRALSTVRPLRKIYVYDLDLAAAQNFTSSLKDEFEIQPVTDLGSAIQKSDLCITCTTATKFFVRKEDVSPGTFIAAVGADDSHKQEIDPALMASAKVVADSVDQCCAIGDTHHAIAAGLMRKENVYAELSEVVAGKKPGRTNEAEVTVFDSTGIAPEDAVAAVAVFERAWERGLGSRLDFAA